MISEYTIKEALAELNISKATLYYRINKLKRNIEPHILTRNGKNFISHEGIEILRGNHGLDGLPDSSDISLDHPDHSPNSSDNSLDCSDCGLNCSENQKQINNDAFNIFKMENEFLKLQIREKDNQIQTLSRLVENSQLLLKHEQDKNTMLIELEKNKEKRILGNIHKAMNDIAISSYQEKAIV